MNRDFIIVLVVLIITLAGFLVLLSSFVIAMRSPNKIKERFNRYVELSPFENEQKPFEIFNSEGISRFRSTTNDFLSILAGNDLHLRLQSSNWQITATEYSVIRLILFFIALISGVAIGKSIFLGIALAMVAVIVPEVFLQRSIMYRRNKFQDQLVDVLVLIRGAVQAGFSLMQSLDVVVKEMPAPACEEFSRLRREVQFGIPLSQALENLSERMESDDFYMVVTAININTLVGGSISLMLTAVTETIRNRAALLGEVRAITSYARFASLLLTLLPFVFLAIIMILNPEYILGSLESPITRLIFIIALIMVFIGNMAMRRISNIRV